MGSTSKRLPKGKKRKRVSKDEYYLDIAAQVAKRSTCLRRNYGAVIVKDDQMISAGYGGAPRKTTNCNDVGECIRDIIHAKRGEHYEYCRAVHAEQNAIIQASRFDLMGGTLYLIGFDGITKKIVSDARPCRICRRMIINSGIKKVVVRLSRKKLKRHKVSQWIKTDLGEIKKKKNGKKTPVIPRGHKVILKGD